MKNLKFVGNTTNPKKTIWNEYVDEKGNSTLEVHTPKTIWTACKNHYFVLTDGNGNCVCQKCGFGQKIVWGINIIKKGKIISLKPAKL